MKTLVSSRLFKFAFSFLSVCALAQWAVAAPAKEAKVTQTIRDVRLLNAKAAARPAVVNDFVREGQGVRTGTQSRAELTFTDQTLTRLGENTIFSFGNDGRNLDLSSGALLLVVPRDGGTKTISTVAATAAVSGGVTMTETSSRSWTKIIVLEGQTCVKLKKAPQLPCLMLHPGEMLTLPPDARSFTQKKNVNLQKVIESAKLVNGFPHPLPGWAENLLLAYIDTGGNAPGGRPNDPTGVNSVSQRNATTGSNQSSNNPPVVHPPGPIPH